MTPEQVMLVQGSWKRVEQIKTTAAELFYGKLFELDPSLKRLFKGDMAEQGRKLVEMIDVVVVNLHKLDRLVPSVRKLGERHSKYGVMPVHYDTVATALLWTLAAGLGDAFTKEVKQAWTTAYLLLAGVMKEAAASHA